METPAKYKVDKPICPLLEAVASLSEAAALRADRRKTTGGLMPAHRTAPPSVQREKVMSTREYYWAAEFSKALLLSGSYESEDEVIDKAIALRDKLIEKVKEK